MAIGNDKHNDSTELVIVQDRTSEDKKKSHFEFVQKVDDAWQVTQKDNCFSGDFKSLKHGMKYDPSVPKQAEMIAKYGNKPIVSVQLKDEASNQTYLYKFTLRLSTRALVNTLLNLTSGANVKIGIYNDREKGYEKFSVRQGDELVKWKYSLDDIPKPEEIRKKNGELVNRDFEAVDKFYLDKIDEFITPASGGEPVSKVAEKKEKVKAKAPVVADEEDSDIPF